MAELKLVSPLLSNMEVVSCISARGAVSVYLVKSTKTAQTYILKHISVPESQKQVDALLFTGAASSTEDAQKYYEQVVTDYREELETLEQLAASPNLDCFRSYQIEPKEDGVGFDIYLLAEHRTTLSEYLADNAITHLVRGEPRDGSLQRAGRSAGSGSRPPGREARKHLLKQPGPFRARRSRHCEDRRTEILLNAGEHALIVFRAGAVQPRRIDRAQRLTSTPWA